MRNNIKSKFKRNYCTMIKAIMPVYKSGTPLSDGNTIIDPSLMKRMVDDFNVHYKNDQFNHYHYGTISGDSFPNVNFEDITHKINDVYIKDDRVMADIDILDTPKGNIVQEIMQQCYGKDRKNIHASLDLIERDGKLDSHSVSLHILKNN